MASKLNRPLVVIGTVSFVYLVVAAAKLVDWPPEVGHVATTIVAVLIVHILDHTYFREEIRTEFEAISAKIVEDVRQQTNLELEKLNSSVGASVDDSRKHLEQSLNALLAEQSVSVAAMRKNSVRRVYSSRAEAAPRIAEALTAPTDVIRLMGVSLNDFFRGDNPQLRDTWVRINQMIQAAEVGEAQQEIRVLMVNPRSFGAVLRSYAETSDTGQLLTLDPYLSGD